MALPAFAPAAAGPARRRVRLAAPTVGAFPPSPRAVVAVRPRRVTARAPCMQAGGGGGDAFNFPGLGGGGGAGGGFFDSPIVREEGQALVRDQDALRRLGHNYGNFDAAGKRLYIDEMEALYERYGMWDGAAGRYGGLCLRTHLVGAPGPSLLHRPSSALLTRTHVAAHSCMCLPCLVLLLSFRVDCRQVVGHDEAARVEL